MSRVTRDLVLPEDASARSLAFVGQRAGLPLRSVTLCATEMSATRALGHIFPSFPRAIVCPLPLLPPRPSRRTVTRVRVFTLRRGARRDRRLALDTGAQPRLRDSTTTRKRLPADDIRVFGDDAT